jgi:hypothetical protein
VDTDNPRRLKPRRVARRPLGAARTVDARPAAFFAAGVLIVLALAGPAAAADPVALPSALPVALPTLPSLPVKTPSPSIALPTVRPTPTVPRPTIPTPTLPQPTLPLPTLPTPSLPTPSLPTPTIPTPTFPTPTLPLPSPSLPIPTPPGSSTVPAGASRDPGITTFGSTASASPLPGLIGAGSKPIVSEPTTGSGGGSTEPGAGRSPLEFIVPGLAAGIPIAVVAFVVLLQVAGGAAWLPVVRRWLDRAPMPGLGQRGR